MTLQDTYYIRPLHQDHESKQIFVIYKNKYKEIAKIGRQRNSSQMKKQEKSPGKVLSKMEASNLSNIEIKLVVIKMLNRVKMEVERNHKKGPTTMKNTFSEMQNTLEGINRRLGATKDRISDLEDKVEKKHPIKEAKIK